MIDYLHQELRDRSLGVVVTESLIMVIINICALMGNMMVCWAVYNNNRLRTLPNIYVVTLAISDILMGSLCMPLSVEVFITAEWTKSFNVCQFQGFFSFFLAFTSLQTMTAMALNRYYRVVKPSLYGKYFTVKRVYLSIAIIIVLASIGASMQMTFGWATYTMHYGKAICFTEFKTPGLEKGYIAFLDACYILFPVFVISVCYLKIFKTVNAHTKVLFKANTGGQDGEGKIGGSSSMQRHRSSLTINVEEIKITKTLFLTVLGFITCWSPIAIIDMIDTYSSHTLKIPRQVYLLWIYMGYGSSSINPFIYGILNRSFRTEFLKILHIRKIRLVAPADSVAMETDWRPPENRRESAAIGVPATVSAE